MAAPCAAVVLAPGATAGARPFAAPASSWSSTTARHGPDALRTPAAHAQGGQDDAQRDGAANGCKKVRSVGGGRVEVGNGARDFAERHAARERAVLHIISVVQTKIFWQQRISMKLSRYSAAHTGRRPERSSAVCAAKAAATAWLCTASGRAAGRRMRGGLSVVLLGVRAQPRLNRRKIAPLPPRRLRLLLHR